MYRIFTTMVAVSTTASTFLVLVVVLLISSISVPIASAFQTPTRTTAQCTSFAGSTPQHHWRTSRLQDTPSPEQEKQEQLKRLGFSKEEIERSTQTGDDAPVKVQVNELPNVDAFTLTAIGFSLIAANFFIFANLGDGGIAGVVATVINTLKE